MLTCARTREVDRLGEMQVRNVARERLRNSEMSLGVGIRTARTVDIAKKNGAVSIEFATTISVAALAAALSTLSLP